MIADVAPQCIGRVRRERLQTVADHRLGNTDLIQHPAGGELLHRVAQPVPAREVHACVDAGGVFAQHLLDHAHVLEEFAPFKRVKEADARDRVRDRDLVSRLMLVFLHREALEIGSVAVERALDPVRERLQSDLMPEQPLRKAQQERRWSVEMRPVQLGDALSDFGGTLVGGHDQPVGESLAPHDRLVAFQDANGEPSQVLHECSPEHDRDGPHLTDRERGDILIRVHERGERLLIDARVGVCRQDGHGLHQARIVDEGAFRQAPELRAVPRGQVLCDERDLLFHQVVVVEQPLRRRSHGDVLARVRDQHTVDGCELSRGVFHQREHRCPGTHGPLSPALAPRKRPCRRGQAFGTEQLASERLVIAGPQGIGWKADGRSPRVVLRWQDGGRRMAGMAHHSYCATFSRPQRGRHGTDIAATIPTWVFIS